MTIFQSILDLHERVLLVGPPKVGKTALASLCTDRTVRHTDEIESLAPSVGWDDAATWWLDKLQDVERVLVDGVIGYRILRTGLREHGSWLPDAVVHVYPEHPPFPRHKAMRQGCWTIWQSTESLIAQSDVVVYDGTESTLRASVERRADVEHRQVAELASQHI